MCTMLIYCRIAIGNEKGLILVDIDLEDRKYGGVQSTKGLARLEIGLEDKKDGSAENTVAVMGSKKYTGQMIEEVSSLITKQSLLHLFFYKKLVMFV